MAGCVALETKQTPQAYMAHINRQLAAVSDPAFSADLTLNSEHLGQSC